MADEMAPAVPTSPAGRVVYLHVGGHKTGTTFLQNVLWRHRDALRRDGTLFPGIRKASHIWASHDLRGAAPIAQRASDVAGAWRRLVAEVGEWDGPSIIDQELFSLARPRDIARAFADLAAAGVHDVHVVFTARDMARQLPAVWQERVKNGDTQTYADFLAEVRDSTDRTDRFWGLHDVPGILAKWGAGLPPERVHVVTVPPPGADPGVLWQRFAATVGLDPARYRTGNVGTNRSLGAAEAAALRLLNVALADERLPKEAYDRFVKFRLADQLAGRPGTRIGLPEAAFDWACGVARDTVQQITAAGYDVVGSLDDLLPVQRPEGADPDAVPARETADAVVFALAMALRDSARDSARDGAREKARER